jgi:hypothetical protein
MENLDQLSAAVDRLGRMTPLDQARTLPGLIEDAQRVVSALSRVRGAVLAELTAPGAEYYRRIPALAGAIPCHRSRIDEALAAHRSATAAPTGKLD